MLAIHPSILAKVVENLKRRTTNYVWVAAIERAAQQLAESRSIHAISDTALRFKPRNGQPFIVTRTSCECRACRRKNPCEHRLIAWLFELYCAEAREADLNSGPAQHHRPARPAWAEYTLEAREV